MADRLTQLQDALDDLATQFYASIRYISTNHSPSLEVVPAAAAGAQQANTNNNNNNHQPPPPPHTTTTTTSAPTPPPPPAPATTDQFTRDLHELARDLILKEQQIELLISVLPGIGTSEREQTARLDRLRRDMARVEAERGAALREKEALLRVLDGLILGLGRRVG